MDSLRWMAHPQSAPILLFPGTQQLLPHPLSKFARDPPFQRKCSHKTSQSYSRKVAKEILISRNVRRRPLRLCTFKKVEKTSSKN